MWQDYLLGMSTGIVGSLIGTSISIYLHNIRMNRLNRPLRPTPLVSRWYRITHPFTWKEADKAARRLAMVTPAPNWNATTQIGQSPNMASPIPTERVMTPSGL